MSLSIDAIALSPDNRELAVSGRGFVHIVDTTTGQQIRSLESPDGQVNHISFSSDGKYVVSGVDKYSSEN